MTKWTPELAQEVWKAEGRRKALRGNSKLWIWFSQDRKRRGGGDKEHSKQIRVSSTLPAGRLPAPPIPASTITDNELLPHSKDFDCPKQNPTQRAAEMNQTVKITLWFMSNHCLHTPLPKATQLQDAFHGCSGTSWEAFTNQKNRCPHHYPSMLLTGLVLRESTTQILPFSKTLIAANVTDHPPVSGCVRTGTNWQWNPFIHILTIHEEPVAS